MTTEMTTLRVRAELLVDAARPIVEEYGIAFADLDRAPIVLDVIDELEAGRNISAFDLATYLIDENADPATYAEDAALGPCGCIDYHYADCSTRTGR